MKAEERRWRRGDLLAVLGALALGVVLAVILLSIQNLRSDLQIANEARDALATQVKGLGATPVAGEPGSRGEVGPSGPPGPPGKDAPSAAPGATGPPGKSGESGKPGADSTAPGPSGAAGRNGSDSTVPGPTGPAGAAGQDGRDGADGVPGQDGADGTDGANGADGRPGEPPVSWTYTDPAGVSYTCRRVDGFDASNPRYTCSADAAPDPAHEALGLFALSSLATYRRLK